MADNDSNASSNSSSTSTPGGGYTSAIGADAGTYNNVPAGTQVTNTSTGQRGIADGNGGVHPEN